jgi:hypothetical protein
MDELLRAYAKKRREQAEPVAEMHPATRKLLQDEVKRTLAAAPTPTRQSWRVWRWPLLVMWGGMAVLLVMFAMLNAQFRSLEPGNREAEDALGRSWVPPAVVAKKQSAARDARRGDRDGRAPQDIGSAVVSTAPAGVPPAAPAAVAGLEVAATPSAPPPSTIEARLPGNAAPAPVGANSENANAPLGVSPALAARAISPVPAAASEAPPPASAPRPTLKAPAAVASASVPVGARFARPAAAAPAPSVASVGADVAAGDFVQVHDRARFRAEPLPPSNLLSNFRMMRSGQKVSVLDADGSVYNGQVLNGTSNRAGVGGALAAKQQAKALKNATDETNWMFNVTGVNNSLNQNIIFTGNVLDMPWANSFDNNAAQFRNSSQFQNGSNGSQAPSTQNSRITGKVQVGGGKPYEIEAKPPSP